MIEYAIPSRDRPETVTRKTIPLLDRLGIERERITVFVSEPELLEYRGWLRQRKGVKVVEGALGMSAQRRAIHRAYPEGTRLIQIDDDIRDLAVRAGEKRLVPISPMEWEDLVEEAFGLCEQTGARLWGLYPVPNPYFMKPRVRTDLSYIGGGLWGCFNRLGDGALDVELEDKEDFERSLRCYAADGAVVRFDYVTWKTEGYHGKGGMQADGLRTDERIRESAETLVGQFPGLATLNLTKKSGKAELRLRDRRKVAAA